MTNEQVWIDRGNWVPMSPASRTDANQGAAYRCVEQSCLQTAQGTEGVQLSIARLSETCLGRAQDTVCCTGAVRQTGVLALVNELRNIWSTLAAQHSETFPQHLNTHSLHSRKWRGVELTKRACSGHMNLVGLCRIGLRV